MVIFSVNSNSAWSGVANKAPRNSAVVTAAWRYFVLMTLALELTDEIHRESADRKTPGNWISSLGSLRVAAAGFGTWKKPTVNRRFFYARYAEKSSMEYA